MRFSFCYACSRCDIRYLLWIVLVLPTILSLSVKQSNSGLEYVNSEKIVPKRIKAVERPNLVTNAMARGESIYYFGIGSNMSRKKLENRALDGTKIEIENMEAGYIKNYRLAFNLRGFPPVEPGFGSVEPVDSGAKAVLKYEPGECHGALIQLTPENYERVMRSEGIGSGDQGYEEIVVDVHLYKQSQGPVKAVALRARDHVRLTYDSCPSARYMSILREGAEELGLRQSYQEFLKRHPVEVLTRWQRKQAIYNIFFMMTISSLLKTSIVTKLQSRLLFVFYTSDASRKLRKILSSLMTAIILLPGSLMGLMLYQILEVLGKTPNSAKRMFDFLDKDHKSLPCVLP